MRLALRNALDANSFVRVGVARLMARRKVMVAIPTVRERRDELIRFYENYETLVEVLCDAANYGPMKKSALAYERLREFLPNDFRHLKPFLGAYAPPASFERLWQSPTLADTLDSDEGDLISAIIDTRHALNMYAEHLRQLSATSA